MVKEKNGKKYAAPAVDGMLDIIEFMADKNTGCGVSELSRALNISTNLVFRILKRLTERGYVEPEGDSGGYILSTKFFSLGMKLYSRFELRLRARPHLEKLSEETGETCQAQVPDGTRIVVADCMKPPADFFLHVVPGSRLYYHANAFGKAVMAFSSDVFVDSALSGVLPRFTPNTLTSKQEIIDSLREVRTTGLAYDNEEYNIGIYCIGAPVFDVNGQPVAGIGISGFSSRFNPENKSKFEKLVLVCAGDISRDIGYTGNFYDNILKDCDHEQR